MSPSALPHTLPYSVKLEQDFVRARCVAAAVTGPAGALLLLASRGQLILGVLGALCVLAAVGWVFAARAGTRRARERAAWQLVLDVAELRVSTAQGVEAAERGSVRSVSLDEDKLQVVLTREAADELRLDPTWGTLGAVDLCALLERWRAEG